MDLGKTSATVANDFVVSEESMKTTFSPTIDTNGTNEKLTVDLGSAATGVAGDHTITFTGSVDEGNTDTKTAKLTIEAPAAPPAQGTEEQKTTKPKGK